MGITDRHVFLASGGSPATGGGPASGGSGAGGGDYCAGDLSCDPNGCGVEGHDCLGGECLEGSCQPRIIARPTAPSSLAVLGSYVYWGYRSKAPSEIHACDKMGCGEDGYEVFLTGVSEVSRLVTYGSTLFIVVQGNPLGVFFGCEGSTECTPVFSTSALNGPTAIAASGETTYLATIGDELGLNGGLYRCTGADCTDPPPIEKFRGTALAVDAGHLYWIDLDFGSVFRCDPDDCIASSHVVVTDAVISGSDLHAKDGWLTFAGSAGNLYRCQVSEAGECDDVVTLATTDSQLAGFVLDETHAYFAEKSKYPRAILRVPLAGGSVETVVRDLIDVIELAQDDDAIYWLSSGTGNEGVVGKVAKPPG